jgi:hypothetical protein
MAVASHLGGSIAPEGESGLAPRDAEELMLNLLKSARSPRRIAARKWLPEPISRCSGAATTRCSDARNRPGSSVPSRLSEPPSFRARQRSPMRALEARRVDSIIARRIEAAPSPVSRSGSPGLFALLSQMFDTSRHTRHRRWRGCEDTHRVALADDRRCCAVVTDVISGRPCRYIRNAPEPASNRPRSLQRRNLTD